MRQILRFVALPAFVLALTAVPNSKISADELIKANPEETQCPAPLVLQLDVPDSVAKKQLAKSSNPDDREPLQSWIPTGSEEGCLPTRHSPGDW